MAMLFFPVFFIALQNCPVWETQDNLLLFFFYILNVKLVQIRVVSSISGHSIYLDNKLLELIVCFCWTVFDWFMDFMGRAKAPFTQLLPLKPVFPRDGTSRGTSRCTVVDVDVVRNFLPWTSWAKSRSSLLGREEKWYDCQKTSKY